MEKKYAWQYCSLGGVVRVRINSGEDIAHLGELDQKLWTVLSCPVDSIEMDPQTLALLDTDKDGKIRVAEVVAAAEWLTTAIKDRDLILKGDTVLPLEQFNTENELGRRLHSSAKEILHNLGLEKNEISLADASDSVAIFKGSPFNGDGVITSISTDDEALKATITDCVAKSAAVPDRGGESGVTADMIEAFYAACADYSAWYASVEADKKNIYPYGDNTQAALDACNVLKEKVEDFFMRSRLLKFDSETAAAVAVPVSAIGEIGNCPIAKPNAEALLPADAINPAWQPAVDKLKSLAPDFLAKPMGEADWNALLAKFGPYTAAMAAKKGAVVESLGIDRVNAILKADEKAALLELVARDKALENEAASIDDVKKLMLYYRDFYKLLRNYVIFTDFYERKPRAIFEVGQLYIDQRCCDLCIKVSNMALHADMPKLSGMFLIYCKCTSASLKKSMDIVAVLTSGDVTDLRPGKNGIFYDCQGNDWDAVITKVVDNPVSISQAFWSPYRKFWEFCVGLINKNAADKESKMLADMQGKAKEAVATPIDPAAAKSAEASKAQPFDIAKFAGIFAALGMAVGMIGSALASLAAGIRATPAWQLLLAILAIMLIISGPSCFIAWSKLRVRNLGPVLNANGWAINSRVLVNILFGEKLTSVAKYPKVRMKDPYAKKSKKGWWLLILAILLIAAGAAFYFFCWDRLMCRFCL